MNALEPEWEARFEPRSYGFRPGRAAMTRSRPSTRPPTAQCPKRQWVLDADLAAAFDRIDHDHILGQLGTFPARGTDRQWLKAGVVEHGRFAPTEEGTPQGGVISPVLLNVALHGMEQAAGVRYKTPAKRRDAKRTPRASADMPTIWSPCATARDQADQVKARLAVWLAPEGLALNEDKTHIVTLDEGFDFLGFNVRRYRNASC